MDCYQGMIAQQGKHDLQFLKDNECKLFPVLGWQEKTVKLNPTLATRYLFSESDLFLKPTMITEAENH